MQGVVKAYDPDTGDGIVLCDSDLLSYDIAPSALEGSVFRMVRQGQRVCFDIVDGLADHLRLGSEADMGTPGFPGSDHVPALDGPAGHTDQGGLR